MLEEELASKLKGCVVVVGVGDSEHGDDGAGPLVTDLLIQAGVQNVIDSGASPELDTWRIRELSPNTVLFVDAVDFGGQPGEVALIEPKDLRSSGFDTHRAPLKLTMEYLENSMDCKCFLLAIQPSCVETGAPMCDDVKRSVADVDILLRSVLAQRN